MLSIFRSYTMSMPVEMGMLLFSCEKKGTIDTAQVPIYLAYQLCISLIIESIVVIPFEPPAFTYLMLFGRF